MRVSIEKYFLDVFQSYSQFLLMYTKLVTRNNEREKQYFFTLYVIMLKT